MAVERKVVLRNLSDRKRVYYTGNQHDDDNYIHCHECNDFTLGMCPAHPLIFVRDRKLDPSKIASNGLSTARLSLPLQLYVQKSPIHGFGIFTKVQLPSCLCFGPYKGKVLYSAVLADKSGYAWQIRMNNGEVKYVDAEDESSSNWMRFVNSARVEQEQNLQAFQFQGELYYRTYKSIPQGNELLVYYGDAYHCTLSKFAPTVIKEEQIMPYACTRCDKRFTAESYLGYHMKSIHRSEAHACPPPNELTFINEPRCPSPVTTETSSAVSGTEVTKCCLELPSTAAIEAPRSLESCSPKPPSSSKSQRLHQHRTVRSTSKKKGNDSKTHPAKQPITTPLVAKKRKLTPPSMNNDLCKKSFRTRPVLDGGLEGPESDLFESDRFLGDFFRNGHRPGRHDEYCEYKSRCSTTKYLPKRPAASVSKNKISVIDTQPKPAQLQFTNPAAQSIFHGYRIPKTKPVVDSTCWEMTSDSSSEDVKSPQNTLAVTLPSLCSSPSVAGTSTAAAAASDLDLQQSSHSGCAIDNGEIQNDCGDESQLNASLDNQECLSHEGPEFSSASNSQPPNESGRVIADSHNYSENLYTEQKLDDNQASRIVNFQLPVCSNADSVLVPHSNAELDIEKLSVNPDTVEPCSLENFLVNISPEHTVEDNLAGSSVNLHRFVCSTPDSLLGAHSVADLEIGASVNPKTSEPDSMEEGEVMIENARSDCRLKCSTNSDSVHQNLSTFSSKFQLPSLISPLHECALVSIDVPNTVRCGSVDLEPTFGSSAAAGSLAERCSSVGDSPLSFLTSIIWDKSLEANQTPSSSNSPGFPVLEDCDSVDTVSSSAHVTPMSEEESPIMESHTDVASQSRCVSDSRQCDRQEDGNNCSAGDAAGDTLSSGTDNSQDSFPCHDGNPLICNDFVDAKTTAVLVVDEWYSSDPVGRDQDSSCVNSVLLADHEVELTPVGDAQSQVPKDGESLSSGKCVIADETGKPSEVKDQRAEVKFESQPTRNRKLVNTDSPKSNINFSDSSPAGEIDMSSINPRKTKPSETAVNDSIELTDDGLRKLSKSSRKKKSKCKISSKVDHLDDAAKVSAIKQEPIVLTASDEGKVSPKERCIKLNKASAKTCATKIEAKMAELPPLPSSCEEKSGVSSNKSVSLAISKSDVEVEPSKREVGRHKEGKNSTTSKPTKIEPSLSDDSTRSLDGQGDAILNKFRILTLRYKIPLLSKKNVSSDPIRANEQLPQKLLYPTNQCCLDEGRPASISDELTHRQGSPCSQDASTYRPPLDFKKGGELAVLNAANEIVDLPPKPSYGYASPRCKGRLDSPKSNAGDNSGDNSSAAVPDNDFNKYVPEMAEQSEHSGYILPVSPSGIQFSDHSPPNLSKTCCSNSSASSEESACVFGKPVCNSDSGIESPDRSMNLSDTEVLNCGSLELSSNTSGPSTRCAVLQLHKLDYPCNLKSFSVVIDRLDVSAGLPNEAVPRDKDDFDLSRYGTVYSPPVSSSAGCSVNLSRIKYFHTSPNSCGNILPQEKSSVRLPRGKSLSSGKFYDQTAVVVNNADCRNCGPILSKLETNALVGSSGTLDGYGTGSYDPTYCGVPTNCDRGGYRRSEFTPSLHSAVHCDNSFGRDRGAITASHSCRYVKNNSMINSAIDDKNQNSSFSPSSDGQCSRMGVVADHSRVSPPEESSTIYSRRLSSHRNQGIDYVNNYSVQNGYGHLNSPGSKKCDRDISIGYKPNECSTPTWHHSGPNGAWMHKEVQPVCMMTNLSGVQQRSISNSKLVPSPSRLYSPDKKQHRKRQQ